MHFEMNDTYKNCIELRKSTALHQLFFVSIFFISEWWCVYE